jgi:hypothetical protein
MDYIKFMRGHIHRARGYGQDGFELSVQVSFDAKAFNRFKKTTNPLAVAMPQIKNVVLDACGVRGMPSYARASYTQAYPRARHGMITLTVTFEVSKFNCNALGVNMSDFCVSHAVDLQSTLDATRTDGHLLAKTAIASAMGH